MANHIEIIPKVSASTSANAIATPNQIHIEGIPETRLVKLTIFSPLHSHYLLIITDSASI